MAVKTKWICRVCGSSRIAPLCALGPYTILKCRTCTFGWPEPLPSEEELFQLYLELYKDSTDSPDAEAICEAFTPERERAVRAISRLRPAPGNLLCVGCGLGEILSIARTYNFRTFGVELNPNLAAEAARKGHNIQVGVLSPSTFQGVSFDVVVLSHIIEHLLSPEELLHAVRERLKEGGLVYIATPNFGSAICRIEGSHYILFAPPVHIAYFTRNSLKHLLEKCGFYLIKQTAITSYYLHTRGLLAYLLRLKFLRKAQFTDPRTHRSLKRFVEGRFRLLRTVIYSLIIICSRLTARPINAFGGEHLQTYWRKK